MFRNEKFLGFVHPYNLLEYFQNKEMDLSKNNSFLTEEAINNIALTEKIKKVPVCEMFECSAFLPLFIMETEERQVYII